MTFSIAGRREGLASDTGLLYRHYVRLLRAFAPAAFIFENVKGLLTAPRDDDTRTAFDVIKDELRRPFRYFDERQQTWREARYALTWRLVDAADYGVPQHRHRVIVLGRRGSEPFAFPEPTHAHPHRLGLFTDVNPWRTVRDAFADLPQAVELGGQPLLRNHVAKRHTAEMRESYRATLPGRRNQRTKRDRLLWDEPSKTIRAQGKAKSDGSGQKNSSYQPIHPDDARLQAFPDWYPFPATLVNAYRIIGDAVPPELARVLAGAIAPQLEAAASEVGPVGQPA